MKKDDKVTFTSYTRPDQKLKGTVKSVDSYYPWRHGHTTVVFITGEDGYEYIINAERVKKAS